MHLCGTGECGQGSGSPLATVRCQWYPFLMSLEKRAAFIKLILSDVDGVLTDGTIEIDHEGNESKRFSTLDGYGIRMWRKAGYHFGFITGRDCPCLYHRAKNLGVEIIRAGTFAKWEAVLEIAAEQGLSVDEIAFIGDDYPDLPAIRGVGLGVTVSHAPQELKNAAEYITQRPGGYGAVRDLIDQILTIKREFPVDPESPEATLFPEATLQFDDQTQTVRWLDQSLKLGGKSYLFLKILWEAPRHRKKTASIEQSVWKTKGRKRRRLVTIKTKKGIRKVRVTARFVSQNTLKLFLFRLQNRLMTALFPYKIVPLKNKKSAEIIGYKLESTKRYTKASKNVP